MCRSYAFQNTLGINVLCLHCYAAGDAGQRQIHCQPQQIAEAVTGITVPRTIIVQLDKHCVSARH